MGIRTPIVKLRRSGHRLRYIIGILVPIKRWLLSEEALGVIQYRMRRLIVRFCKDLGREISEFSNCYHILQGSRQHFCRIACQIWQRYDHFNILLQAFETLRDLTMWRFMRYWINALEDVDNNDHWNKTMYIIIIIKCIVSFLSTNQYPRHLFIKWICREASQTRSHKISNPRDWVWECVCHISEQSGNFKRTSKAFEISWDIAIRRLIT